MSPRRQRFLGEVDLAGQAGLEGEAVAAEAGGEQFGDVAVGHQQVGADQEGGAGIGDAGMADQLEPADRRQGRQDGGAIFGAVEMLPVMLGDRIIVAGDVDHRAAVRDDDRLQCALLEPVHRAGIGELAERALDRLLLAGGEIVEAGDRLGPAGVEAFQSTDRLDLAKEAGGLLGDKVRHATSLSFGRSSGDREAIRRLAR